MPGRGTGRQFSSAENKLQHKVASTAAANCLQQAKVRGLAAIHRRLKHGSLKDKQWWFSVKKAGCNGRQAPIPVLKDDAGCEFVTSREKGNRLGKFFSSNCCLGDWDIDNADLPLSPARCTSTLTIIRFRPITVERHLHQLDAKATGPDGVPSHVLKECAASLADPLSRLFSLCFHLGLQPDMWGVVPVQSHEQS